MDPVETQTRRPDPFSGSEAWCAGLKRPRSFSETGASRRKRPNGVVTYLTVVESKDARKDGKAPDGCVALGSVNVPENKEVLRDFMPDLERMGLKTLVKQRWDISSVSVCQEYIRIQSGRTCPPSGHRTLKVSFDEESLVGMYNLSCTGHSIGPPCSAADQELVAEFFNEAMPQHGWNVKSLADRHPKLCKVFQVLNAIFRPDRPTQVKKEMAVAVCKAWTSPEEDIDWAGYLSRTLRRLRDNMGGWNKCYLSPFLLHAYRRDNLLTIEERRGFFTGTAVKPRGVQSRNGNPIRAADTRETQSLNRNSNRCAIVAASKNRALDPTRKSTAVSGKVLSSGTNQDQSVLATPFRRAPVRSSQVNPVSRARTSPGEVAGRSIERCPGELACRSNEFRPNDSSERAALERQTANECESLQPDADDPKIVEKAMKRFEIQRNLFVRISKIVAFENDREVLDRVHSMVDDLRDRDEKLKRQKDTVKLQQYEIEDLKDRFHEEEELRQRAEEDVIEWQGRCRDLEDSVENLQKLKAEEDSQKKAQQAEARKRQEEVEVFQVANLYLREKIAKLEQQGQELQEQAAACEKDLSEKQQALELKSSLLQQSEEMAAALVIENCSVQKKLTMLLTVYDDFGLMVSQVRGVKVESS